MKTHLLTLATIIAAWGSVCLSETSANPRFLSALAWADTVGIGVHGGDVPAAFRINNATYWLGNVGTNSVLLSAVDSTDGPMYPQEAEANGSVIFFGTPI